MTTKLTLTVEKDVIERAKSYAKESGRSLSQLIEQYLDTITQENSTQSISPKLKKLIGAVKLPKDFDEKKELQYYLDKKNYGKKNVDTNILVDLLADRKPLSKYAVEIFNASENKKEKLFTSSHSIVTKLHFI